MSPSRSRSTPPRWRNCFTEARTHNEFLDRPVPDELLKKAVDIAKMGPTSANQSPMRIVFVKSPEAKARLAPAMSEGNRAKTVAAPVAAIVAYDEKFYEHLPFLFPHADAKAWFSGNEAFAKRAAFQNGTLQVAYLILALRAVGLDTGPMSGFDNAKVDAEFFPDSARQVERHHQHRLRRPLEAVPAQPAFRLRSDRQDRLSEQTRRRAGAPAFNQGASHELRHHTGAVRAAYLHSLMRIVVGLLFLEHGTGKILNFPPIHDADAEHDGFGNALFHRDAWSLSAAR